MNNINQHSKKSTGTWITRLVILGCLFVLTACGGGGGGDDPVPPVNTLVLIHTKVSGLVLPGLVLQNNGGDDLSIPGNGLYNFKTPLAPNSSYSVTVSAQPAGSLCTVVDGTGTVGAIAPVINVVCAATSTSLTIGGTVNGLQPGSMLILNNNGNDLKTVTSSGAFVFDKEVAYHSGYTVTVKAQPSGQICTVSKSSGEFITQPVTDIVVTCSAADLAHQIGGAVTGLAQNNQITLKNNSDDPLLIKTNGKFVFNTKIANLSSYHVTVANQPANQTCTVTNASGAGIDKDVNNVAVDCSAVTFTIGGTVTGLSPDTQVTLLNNGADPLPVTAANGKFTFSKPVAQHDSYLITVGAQPQGQICTAVANYTRDNINANITDVAITCSTKRYTISGTITGLQTNSPITFYNNGTDPKTVFADGKFTFDTPVAEGGSYVVTIAELPFIQSCQLVNGTGKLVTADVDTVQVNCNPPVFQVMQNFNYSNGAGPFAKLIQDSEGNFYGTTFLGGDKFRGTVFKITPQNELVTLAHFGDDGGPQYPSSDLIFGRDGNLYGTSTKGGASDAGTVFMLKPDGSELTVVYPFEKTARPEAGLVEVSDGVFYGTTPQEGVNNNGYVFRVTVNPVTKKGTALIIPFDGTNGSTPVSKLVQDGNLLYGTTRFGGGPNGVGTIYSITLNDDQQPLLQHLYTFTGVDGNDPTAPLVKGIDGNFYGVTAKGGLGGRGTLYGFDPVAKNVKPFFHFAYGGVKGADPVAGLTSGADGSLYGVTQRGANVGDLPTLFRFTPPAKSGGAGMLETLYLFNVSVNPMAGLLQGLDGNLYGVTRQGGSDDSGMVYKFGR